MLTACAVAEMLALSQRKFYNSGSNLVDPGLRGCTRYGMTPRKDGDSHAAPLTFSTVLLIP